MTIKMTFAQRVRAMWQAPYALIGLAEDINDLEDRLDDDDDDMQRQLDDLRDDVENIDGPSNDDFESMGERQDALKERLDTLETMFQSVTMRLVETAGYSREVVALQDAYAKAQSAVADLTREVHVISDDNERLRRTVGELVTKVDLLSRVVIKDKKEGL